MELESELRVEAVALSILLLPQTHINTLLYLLDVSPRQEQHSYHNYNLNSCIQDNQTINKHIVSYLLDDGKELLS